MRRRSPLSRWRGRTVAVGVALLLVACSDAGPEVPERAAVDAPARTTSTTAAPPPSLERIAAGASVLPGEGDTRFTRVVVGSRAIVVTGDDDGEAAIWTSGDAVSFTPADLDTSDFPLGAAILDLVVTDDGYVAVGTDGARGAAWASSDGSSWLRSDLRDGTSVDVVIVGELGITAFGRDGASLATWSSFDGVSWERVPGGAAVFPAAGPARIVGAYDDGDGFLVVADRDGVAETWSSPDGRTWDRAGTEGADLLPAVGPPRPEGLLGAGSTAVVVGAVEDPDGVDAAVWTALSGAPWERASPREEVFGGDGAQVASAAAQLGADLVAVGTDTDDLGDVDAVVWSTGDGGGWRRSGERPGDGLSGPGDQHAVDLAPTRDGALVVGWEADDAGTRAVAWTLVDGELEPVVPLAGPALAWQRIPPAAELGGPGEQRLEAVVAAEGVLVAVGSSHRPDDPGADVDGAVWRSPDGLAWERVAVPALGGPGDQRALDVASTPTGLVAVGADGPSAAVWTSVDAEAWTRATGDEAVFGGDGEQVAAAVAAAAGGMVVAVGVDGGVDGGDAAVWRSTDGGGTWTRVPGGGALGGPGPQAMADVTVAGPLLVAVGRDGDRAAAWSSLDGLAWERVDLGAGAAEAIVAGELGVVAVGSTGAGGERDATTWRSSDGRAWRPVPMDDGPLGAADQEALAVALTPTPGGEPLLAAVGRTSLGPGDDAASWASADGRAWTRGPHVEDLLGGDQAQRMVGLAVLGDVVVAVGSSGSTPEARDGAVWITAPAGGGGGVL